MGIFEYGYLKAIKPKLKRFLRILRIQLKLSPDARSQILGLPHTPSKVPGNRPRVSYWRDLRLANALY